MQEKFRPFTQFHTATEHDQFLRNMAKERALRLRIRELIKYRRNGLTRHEDCIEYERLRYFRERRKEARLERQRRKSVRLSNKSKLFALNGLSAPCLEVFFWWGTIQFCAVRTNYFKQLLCSERRIVAFCGIPLCQLLQSAAIYVMKFSV